MADEERPPKRHKPSHEASWEGHSTSPKPTSTLASLKRSISPPLRQLRSQPDTPSSNTPREEDRIPSNIIPSPVQLTHIRDLSVSSGNNTDTIKLRDILGDPLIKECWQFNYMFDVDFVMRQFDEDVRNLVQVKLIHGSWKRESPNRIHIDEACRRYPNVEPIIAYMPEPFGTHHSKMMILIRHDEQAQVIIHTANMIPGDWANMCQAAWRSPLLPMIPKGEEQTKRVTENRIGLGTRFKRDLLAYLEMYGHKKTGPLIEQLEKYDFDAIRAALIASVPSRQADDELNSERQTLWGWPALKDTIRQIPFEKGADGSKKKPHIVIQISSVATLGQTDKWLKETFFNALSPSPSHSSGIFKANRNFPSKFSIVFPTPDEVRRSLNGYVSGGSIHMKLQSTAQQKQLQYLRPYLCRWAGDTGNGNNKSTKGKTFSQETVDNPGNSENRIREAGRRRAAPHIKTYVRFSDADMTTIDWAMVTSANLSLQAWGAASNGKKEIRICSWEIGVLIWPDLFADMGGGTDNAKSSPRGKGKEVPTERNTTTMVPCFRKDTPDPSQTTVYAQKAEPGTPGPLKSSTLIGFRMPYDLPLTPYTSQDQPWCATAAYSEPDWLGQTWEEG
ncbi:hypothetical protein FQN52_009199 [Onygenales sp. PD_12]|nr:hypothetical protein FQN52_009199 [Onygenales sp. PD_12]